MAAMQSGEPERSEVPAEGAPGPPPPSGWAPPPAGWPHPPAAPWGPAAAIPGWNAETTRPQGFGRFRPMEIGELLDASFVLYRRNLLLLVAISAVVQVPFAILNLVVFQLLGVGAALDAAGSPGFTVSPSGTLSGAQVTAFKDLLAYLGLVVVVQMLVVLPLSLAAMSRAVSDRYLDRPASLGSSYAAAARRGGALLGAILLLLLLIGGVSVVMLAAIAGATLAGPFGILPAIGLLVAWLVLLPLIAVRSTVFAPAIVVEGVGSVAGLQRSWRLTRGAFWRTFAVLVVVLLLQTVVGWVLQVPVGLLLSGTSTGTQEFVGQAVSAVTSVAVSPLSLIALTLVYYDLRIRREAFDIEMLAASL